MDRSKLEKELALRLRRIALIYKTPRLENKLLLLATLKTETSLNSDDWLAINEYIKAEQNKGFSMPPAGEVFKVWREMALTVWPANEVEKTIQMIEAEAGSGK